MKKTCQVMFCVQKAWPVFLFEIWAHDLKEKLFLSLLIEQIILNRQPVLKQDRLLKTE